MGMVDTAQAPGWFAFNGPSELLGGDMTYQVFLPLSMLDVPIRSAPELRAALFEEHLKTAWGTLLLTGRQCSVSEIRPARSSVGREVGAETTTGTPRDWKNASQSPGCRK